MISCTEGVFRALTSRGVCHVYHVYYFCVRGKLLRTPVVWLVSPFVVAIAGRPLPLVFDIYLAGLFEDPTTSVGVISWFIWVAMDLAGPIQYFA